MSSTMTATTMTGTGTAGSVVALDTARLRAGHRAPAAFAQGTAVPIAGPFGAHVVGGADDSGTVHAPAAADPRVAINAKSVFRTPHPSVRWSDDL